MPITDIIILSFISFGFIVFAVAVAWGDHQTRDIARASREQALTGARVASLLAGAETTHHAAGEKSKETAAA